MPQIIVLDTHIWFWLMTEEFERFPTFWQDEFNRAELVGISSISCYELALAQQRGRLQLPCAVDEWFAEALDPAGIELFSLTPKIAYQAVRLSSVHRDPFDRMIIATALDRGAKLASVDGLFAQYPELTGLLMKQGP